MQNWAIGALARARSAWLPRRAESAISRVSIGYRGLTREACTLDLRQFTGWCCARSVPLFSVRRADIEACASELEAKGRAPGQR